MQAKKKLSLMRATVLRERSMAVTTSIISSLISTMSAASTATSVPVPAAIPRFDCAVEVSRVCQGKHSCRGNRAGSEHSLMRGDRDARPGDWRQRNRQAFAAARHTYSETDRQIYTHTHTHTHTCRALAVQRACTKTHTHTPRAGESLIPSPTIATYSPASWSSLTLVALCLGSTPANTCSAGIPTVLRQWDGGGGNACMCACEHQTLD